MVRIVEHDIAHSNGIETVGTAAKTCAIERRQFFVFEVVAAWVGEGNKVFKAVVTPAWDQAFCRADVQVFFKHHQHVFGHFFVIY